MIRKYYTGGPWEDILGEDFDNSLKHVDFNNPDISLSKPGNISLKNVYDNFNLKLKKPKSFDTFSNDHPYFVDTFRGAKSLLKMGLDARNMGIEKKAQRDYFNDVRNLYSTYDMEKYGQTPYVKDTATYTDYPNEKVIPFENEVGGFPRYKKQYTNIRMAKKGGAQLYQVFEDGGSVNQMGSVGNLPKYKLGSLSPVQRVLTADSKHYGIPMAKKGLNFVPDKPTANTENYEYYEKPGQFLGYVKDMAQNKIVQDAYGRKRKGLIEDDVPMAQLGMGMGNFEEFGYDNENPLTNAYTNLYSPQTQKQFLADAPEQFVNSFKMAFSKPIANRQERQAEQQQQINTLLDIYNNMNNSMQTAKAGGLKRYKTTGTTKPTIKTPAEFENWYNTTMGNLISSGASPEDIDAFVKQAKQWAYDFKNYGSVDVDPNSLQTKSFGPLTIGSRADAYNTELESLIADSELEYENALASNADQATLDAIEAKRTQAMADLDKKYPVSQSPNPGDYYYGANAPAAGGTQPGAAPGTAPGTTPGTAPGTQPGTQPGAGGTQSYKPMFDPAVMNVLAAMAQGYTKTPLFGFRSNRNMRALLNQAMAQSLLNYVPGAGTQVGPQGAATAGAGATGQGTGAGTGTAPAGTDYNTWIRDNNINRYDITQRPNVYKMRIRANQPGQDLVQLDQNGNPISDGGFGSNLLDRLRESKEARQANRQQRRDARSSEINPRRMERQTKRDYKKFMEEQEAERKYRQGENAYSPLQPTPSLIDPFNPQPGPDPLLPGYGPGIPLSPVGVGNIIPPPGYQDPANAQPPAIGPMQISGPYGGGPTVTPQSIYPGTEVDMAAAAAVIQRQADRARMSQKLMGEMGNSLFDRGEYGPLAPGQMERANNFSYLMSQMGSSPSDKGEYGPKPPIGKMYGGSYQEGGIYELDDYTVQALRQLGYDIEDLD